MKQPQSYTVVLSAPEASSSPTHRAPGVLWTLVDTAQGGDEQWIVTVAAEHVAPLEQLLNGAANVLAWERRPTQPPTHDGKF